MPLSLGPDVAGALLDEAFADGCYTVMVDTNEADPEARSFTHPDFDPVWARFAERDVPLLVHIAVNGHYDPVSPSFKNNGRGSTAVGGDAPDSNLGLVAMHNSAELFLSAMILDEVFERHDGLRCLSLEHGASWVPGWLHKLDFVERSTRSCCSSETQGFRRRPRARSLCSVRRRADWLAHRTTRPRHALLRVRLPPSRGLERSDPEVRGDHGRGRSGRGRGVLRRQRGALPRYRTDPGLIERGTQSSQRCRRPNSRPTGSLARRLPVVVRP